MFSQEQIYWLWYFLSKNLKNENMCLDTEHNDFIDITRELDSVLNFNLR